MNIWLKDLGLKPSTVEQAEFEYSLLGKIFDKGLKEEDKKEGLLKRLKNTETNQNSNNNDRSSLSSARSKSSFYFTSLSSARNESSKKTSINDDEFERNIYFPDVANMKGINNYRANKWNTNFF